MPYKEPKIKDCKTIVDFAYYHRSRYLNHQAEFQQIFGKPLKSFWGGNLTGFDVVAFDHWVNREQIKSCTEFILEKYGEKAIKLLNALI